MSRSQLSLLAVLVITLCGLGWALDAGYLTKPSEWLSGGYPPPKAINLSKSEMEELAQTGCECERGGDDATKCWSDYKIAVPEASVMSVTMAACGQTQPITNCVASPDGETCFTRGYNNKDICNEAEANAVRAANEAGGSEAVEALLAQFRGSEKLADSDQVEPSCG